MKKCVYAGSFDPLTLGHMHIIERCAMMFDEVVVAIGVNAEKKNAYKKEDRLKMLELACARFSNVSVAYFDGYVADFMRDIDAEYYARGIRDSKDLDYEERTFEFNSKRNENIITMFFTAPKELKNISSTYVKKMIKEHKSIKKLVPDEIYDFLLSLKL